jgi:hypothetical protein
METTHPYSVLTIQQRKELISLSPISAPQFLPLGLPPCSSSWPPAAAATGHYLAHERTVRPDLVICRCGRIWWRVCGSGYFSTQWRAAAAPSESQHVPSHGAHAGAHNNLNLHSVANASSTPWRGAAAPSGLQHDLGRDGAHAGEHNDLDICRRVFDSAGEGNDANHDVYRISQSVVS